MDIATKKVLDLWSTLFPVPGYTSGYIEETSLYIPTDENLKIAFAKIEITIIEIKDKLPNKKLQFCADRLLILFKSVLENNGPTVGVTQAGDGFFYTLVKETNKPLWLENYINTVISSINFEVNKWSKLDITYETKRGCLDAADYLKGCFEAIKLKWTIDSSLDKNLSSAIEKFKSVFYEPNLDTNKVKELLNIFKINEESPTAVKGYPNLLNKQFNLGLDDKAIMKIANDLLEKEMPIVQDLSNQMAIKLGLPINSTIEEVWNKQSEFYAVEDETAMSQRIFDINSTFGAEYIIGINKSDIVTLEATPPYLTAMVTGGEDRAVNYLTSSPSSVLYYTSSKNTSLLTMINIIVHELSHGYNFVKAAQHAGSPLLNLFSPILEVLTEGMAFFREYQYYDAAQQLLEKSNLNKNQQDYLNLYGNTYKEQEQAILGAKFETYIWRVIRYIRALCDTKVNGGEMTYTAFLDWAAKKTQISKEYLHGECFTFLSQAGYAPCYTIGGYWYQKYQEDAIKNNISELTYNTTASNIGFMPWTEGVKELAEIANGKLKNN